MMQKGVGERIPYQGITNTIFWLEISDVCRDITRDGLGNGPRGGLGVAVGCYGRGCQGYGVHMVVVARVGGRIGTRDIHGP
jgi:hypothetical protein